MVQPIHEPNENISLDELERPMKVYIWPPAPPTTHKLPTVWPITKSAPKTGENEQSGSFVLCVFCTLFGKRLLQESAATAAAPESRCV